MTDVQNAAAMALFRLIGAGATLQVHRLGVDLVMPPDLPETLADAAAPFAIAIGELLRLQIADGPCLKVAHD